jgi:anhydro-N-acetylmuramic acid kinase
MNATAVLGLMSGTSMDGLDLALCTFSGAAPWQYTIVAAETIPYPEEWRKRLSSMPQLSGEALLQAHHAYGTFLGRAARQFLDAKGGHADFIASHGHTVFHQPARGFTFQAGAGPALAAAAGIPVVYDFRSADVALGGQGAPLVPVGDRLLFPSFDYCLNLGGIANISFERSGVRTAFDVCPCNLLLNELAGRAGKPFDDKGKLAASGVVLPDLLAALDAVPYYGWSGPRSLGREDIERDFLPLLDTSTSISDQMSTVVEHIAGKIASSIEEKGAGRKLLITGGGAWNTVLVERIARLSGAEIAPADDVLIGFKEALVFAFLGMLRWRGLNNVLASVTGASRDHCAGSIAMP